MNDDRQSLAGILAESAQDREKLLAQLRTADVSAKARPTKRWLVVEQGAGITPGRRVCQHRWERLAVWCAARRQARNDDFGFWYEARRADS